MIWMDAQYQVIQPGQFEAEKHFYPKVLNSTLHPLVAYFLNMSRQNIIERYTHLHPAVSKTYLDALLHGQSRYFYWGGADLFYVTNDQGQRQLVVLEVNSCPSGQKSMPFQHPADEYRGYRQLLENSFIPLMKKRRLPHGAVAVMYDKNFMEASGYAAALADLLNEPVYLVSHFHQQNALVTFEDGVMVLTMNGERTPIRAAFRYVTQKPWDRIPVETKTFIYNSSLVCLAGGRNKLLASKAYELFNSELLNNGLFINTPDTVRDVNKVEVPLWVNRFGGFAVVKNPYSNAGQGVYTITSAKELDAFMEYAHDYDQFIVQRLIGHPKWSSSNDKGRLYHIGTMPSKHSDIYVADLRMMVYSSPEGFSPCAIYARRAHSPLQAQLTSESDSWSMLGTNLSIKQGENCWESDTKRLMQMDTKDFNALGIGLDDLIEAFIQTVMSVTAIDHMAVALVNKKGKFRRKLFKSLDNDPQLLAELLG